MTDYDDGMAPGVRDEAWHKAEYQRRLALVRQRGLSSDHQEPEAPAAAPPPPTRIPALGTAMPARRFAEGACLIVVAAGMVLMSYAKGTLGHTIGALLVLGPCIWYFTKGQALKGWVGADRPQIVAALAAAEAELERMNSLPLGSPERASKFLPAHKRRDALEQTLRDFDREAQGRR